MIHTEFKDVAGLHFQKVVLFVFGDADLEKRQIVLSVRSEEQRVGVCLLHWFDAHRYEKVHVYLCHVISEFCLFIFATLR